MRTSQPARPSTLPRVPRVLAAPILPLACLAWAPLSAQGPQVDWTPNSQEVVLNTESQVMPTPNGPVTVTNGVFVFRNVVIPQGTTVRGVGRNPLVFVLAGTLKVDGVISVRGGDGQRVDTLSSANFPAAGGSGECGGGAGGAGSPSSTARSFTGATGTGPLRIPNFGGVGGRINCANPGCGIGSGGGGGAFATRGDPYYPIAATTHFVQPSGFGGYGCVNRTSTSLPGGAPGAVYFRDGDPSNDFFGVAFDLNRQRWIVGELPMPVGGSGGGGGGDFALSCATNDPLFIQDDKGGGGGAGGGVFLAIANGTISVGPAGRVDANGGDGGGGAWAGSNLKGGGGGGGAGGMVLMFSRSKIAIEVHGETFANGDYDFPIRADGGVCRQDVYLGGFRIRGKYDPLGTATQLDVRPTGGFGGLGVVQLFAPPGANADGTNTILDDNVELLRNNIVLRGAEKQRYLAWRGFPDAAGVWRDDRGNVLQVGNKIGDIHPTPILLPAF
ncbi:MAG: hypothetical protein H6837_05930 [Planctomycetes bacterium]|nr:hypothetical protein [Planctomycetota bacterium]